MIERGSRSFGAAAKLFDTHTRESAYMLYAWCRYCDDQIDGQPQIVEGLTKEQARQLFEAATQDTKSLEEYLQQVLVVPGEKPAQDW